MKITVQIRHQPLDKYTKCLFNHLQNDKAFEGLIIDARESLGLDIPVSQAVANLEVSLKPFKSLRSDVNKIPKTQPDTYVETPFALKLNNELDKILLEYRFLQDWREGLSSLIVNNYFIVSDISSTIKLRVRNKKYPYLGRFTDLFSEDGVKIVLTSKVSKTNFREFIKDNWDLINQFLDDLPTLSKKSLRKPNYERTRLIAYLRQIKMPWGKIALQLKDLGEKYSDYKTMTDSLQQAYKDFPWK